jgi:dienelactone hydrolase
MKTINSVLGVLAAIAVQAQAAPQFDAAAAFGARPSATSLDLSPDGTSVAYVVPIRGQGNALITTKLEKGAQAKTAFVAVGKPEHIAGCAWVSNDRLVCYLSAVVRTALVGLVERNRVIAVDADGKNYKTLSTRENGDSRGFTLGGGAVIDWLPDESGSVLMARLYVPDSVGRFGSEAKGLGVDRIDTRTLAVSHVEPANPEAFVYISDGRGTVRIMGTIVFDRGMNTGTSRYFFRPVGSHEWQKLSEVKGPNGDGFRPVAVDHDLNVAYGFKKKDGRSALYTLSLDGAAHEELVFARPDVDVDDIIQIGRRRQVVGASYATDTRHAVYLSQDVKQTLEALSRALPGAQLRVRDSTNDGSKMLIFAGSDDDPGVYYVFDREARKLQTFLVVRDQLEGVKLAKQKAISYPADDGVMVPAYLTLPPGQEDAKGLPAIVLPHGGPSARDEWGFDWLSQFFAHRGFAVLQPNFRGSSGYGDAWFRDNGFKSWRVAIGDILAAGHWLASQGIADPKKLAIVGWSYGGYAALQSAVVEPGTFKAVIAIAPVTDLSALKEQYHKYTDYEVISDLVGDGPQVREGSPIEHAAEIKVPVLMFHGTADNNVYVAESQRMAEKLKSAGARCELVTWDDLDHNLNDTSARTQMLNKSDAFLREALGM